MSQLDCIEQEMMDKANKLKALISQMIRHETLNKSDMPIVCEILTREMHNAISAANNVRSMRGSFQNDTN